MDTGGYSGSQQNRNNAPGSPSAPSHNGIPYRAAMDYCAGSAEELEMTEGDVLEVIERSGVWWLAIHNGKRGYVPQSFLEPTSGSVGQYGSTSLATKDEVPSIPSSSREIPFEIPVAHVDRLVVMGSNVPSSSRPILPKLQTDSAAASSPSPKFTSASTDTSLVRIDSPHVEVASPAEDGTRVLPTTVRALCDVTAETEGDLSFKKGEIITVDLRSTADVWHGYIGGRSGNFRLNFSVEPILKDQVRALWPFRSSSPDDLSFEAGDIIQVHGPSSSSTWWWHGWIAGKGLGTFPFNFVEPLDDYYPDTENDDTQATKVLSKSVVRFRVLNEVIPREEGMLALRRGDIIHLVERRFNDNWLGRIKSETGMFVLDDNILPLMTDRVKALYSYSPTNPEELQFNVQDIITVVGPSDDSTHWWYGALDGRLGLFPLNYVDFIPDEKKPEAEAEESEVVPVIQQPQVVKALWDFQSNEPTDLAFKKDDVIHLLDISSHVDWWQGKLNGQIGWFPSVYCEKLVRDGKGATPAENGNPNGGGYISGSLIDDSEDYVRIPSANSSLNPSPVDVDPPKALPQLSSKVPVSRPSPPVAKSEAGVPYVKAMWNYEPSDPLDLAFYKGDIIELLDMPAKPPSEWWRGRLNGRVGIFPSNHVGPVFYKTMSANEGKPTQKIDRPQHARGPSSPALLESPQRMAPSIDITSSSDRLPWSPCFVRALYSYEQVEATDLSFLKGDLIEITSMKDPNWWRGKLRDQIGLVPSNFVELIDLRGPPPRIIPNTIEDQRVFDQNSPPTKKELRLLIPNQTLESTLLSKKESNSPKPSPTMPHAPPSALSPASAAYPTTARWVRARHKWNSGKKQELEIQKGDVIQVLDRPHEHWWKGVLARNGVTGLFPANYVEAIRSTAESPSHPFGVGSPVNVQVMPAIGEPSMPSAVKKAKLSTSNNQASTAAPPIPDPRHWGSLRRDLTTSSGRSTVLPQVPSPSDPSSSRNTMNQSHRRPVKEPVGNRGKATSPVESRYEGRLSFIEADIAKAREQYPSDAPRKEAKTRGLPTALAIFKPGRQRNQRPTIDGSDEHKTIYRPDKYNVIRHVVHGNHSPLPRNNPGGSRP
ncbi:hypothetical protein CPB86DRAFT_869628 [Serendipita vermifera]|nr:hypothetical protein CPB86DRAFT_869628 [Serendipita vermifera]